MTLSERSYIDALYRTNISIEYLFIVVIADLHHAITTTIPETTS